MTTKSSDPKVVRHSPAVRFIHWTVTISIFLLIFSGIGQMPMYKRYMLDQLPGLAWSSNYSVTLAIHYLAAAALIFASLYHVITHVLLKEFNLLPRRGDIRESYLIMKAILTKGQEPPSRKYLAEQRLAYAFLAFNIALTIISGLIKVLKNFPSIYFSDGFLYWTTMVHNVATVMVVFGVAAHLGAFIMKENRHLLPGMFTGKVDLCYVKNRHSIWYDELLSQKKINAQEAEKCHS